MKSAIIIGASSGIGRALAVTLSREGYRLGLVARRGDLLNELKTELATPSVIKVTDVSRPDVAIPELRELVTELGDVELFVISAGAGLDNASLDWEPEQTTIGVNVVGFAAMVNVAVTHLEKRRAGHLVGISSLAALRGIGGAPAYAASKAGLDQLNNVMAVELGEYGIRVNSVNPTVVMTKMGKRAWSDPAKGKPMLDRIPLRRFAECDEIASVVCFLLSDAASMLNGLSLRVDGGFLVT